MTSLDRIGKRRKNGGKCEICDDDDEDASRGGKREKDDNKAKTEMEIDSVHSMNPAGVITQEEREGRREFGCGKTGRYRTELVHNMMQIKGTKQHSMNS